ncbi:MAG: enoyl-CoA hydratase/isomerase family protein [Dehalococcoidales bacterium]|nr:enoyl-CoA hydratase/isomerase family protein [Dehalococcoidales bacterium]
MSIDYKKSDKIAIITINRPEAHNAINVQTWKELNEALTDLRDDPGLWVGIITGSGEKAFCAGADVSETLPYMRDNHQINWPAAPRYDIGLYKPLIAAINGVALGGGMEIALACDIRIAVEKARLGTPEVTLGVIPGWGGTQKLPRVIPWAKAAEMVMLGRPVDAQEAYRIGLVNKVVPADKLMEEAMQWAEAFCKVGPLAARAAKEALVRGYSMPLEDGLHLEGSFFDYLLKTQDYIEGTSAFLEKRTPDFKAK